MDNNEFLLRKDNIQKIYLSENNFDVLDILKGNYDYILESMQEEGLNIKCPYCSLFKEIVYENMVVGFCSYDFSREFITAALNNIYIMPQFRGNRLFLSELEKTMVEHNKPSIVEPTRLIVELLIKYGYAEYIDRDIVASSVEFIVPGEHVISNVDYDSKEELSTHFYDLNTCASIHFLDLERSLIAYSSPLNYDIDHYDCLEKRKSIDDEYLSKIKEVFSDEEKLMKIVLDLEERLSLKSYTLEEIIGPDGELSPYIESLIDDAHVTFDDALKIKQQIKEEYEAGMILNESLLIRLAYLFEKPHEPAIKSHSDVCQYCNMPVDNHDKFCHFCGINLKYNPDEMFDCLFETIKSQNSDFKEDIRYVAYKFLRLIDEGIEFDYAVLTIENTYYMDWVKINEFLKDNDYFTDEITEDGYDFLFNHPLNYYEEFNMSCIDYTDFERYFYENENLPGIEICLNYLNQFKQDEDVQEIIDEINTFK